MVKVLHIKSNVVTDNKPKLPTKEQIEYGEIAVNYAADHETISLKNSEDEIKTFSSDEYYTKQKLGAAFTDSTVTDVLNNELKTKLNVADFNSYSGSVSNNEQVIAGGISELKNKVDAATATTYTKTDVDNKLAAKLDTSAYTKVNISDFATAANTYTKSEVDSKIPVLPQFRTINGNAITGDTTDITIQGGTSSTSYDDTKIKADIKALQDGKLDKTDYTPYNDSEIRQEISTKQDKGDYALKGDSYTKAESDGKYLTEHQDISGKLDKTTYYNDIDTFASHGEVNGKIMAAEENIEENIMERGVAELAKKLNITDFNSYSGNVNTKLDDKLDTTAYTPYNDTQIKADIATKLNTSDFNTYTAGTATKLSNVGKVDDVQVNGTSVVNGKVANIDLSSYATTANTYTKSEVDTALSKKQDVLTIDDKLDKTSTNAVQNKAIATELENLMKAISGVLNDINERLNTLSNTVAKQIKNSTE